jgi:membrane fusion protein, multidrug efflux system
MSRYSTIIREAIPRPEEPDWVDFPATQDPPDWARAPARRILADVVNLRGTGNEPENVPPDPQPNKPGFGLKRAALVLVLLAFAAVGGYFGHYWWTTGRFVVSTDDAYVGAHATTIAAKIPGYIDTIAVEDNQHVRAGQVIARIDDGDYRLAADAARDKIATQKATIERIGGQIAAQAAAVDQARAQIASAEAAATQAQLELARQQALANREWASRQKLEQAQANRDQTAAALESAKAQLKSAAANVDVLEGERQEAAQTLKELETSLAKAERDLSFAVIRAPFDGVIGNRAVQTGDYVQPGQRLASLVPLDAIYIDANFKETQLARLEAGQTATIAVDALPGRKLAGSIMSFAPASGSVFSLLPPDNATGNFTKIVQRVPVRIAVPAEVAREGVLRPGMSVVVSVQTKSPAAAASRTMAQR